MNQKQNKLYSLLKMQDKSVFPFLKNELNKDYYFETDNNNYLFCKPKSKKNKVNVCLVSHIDTVRSNNKVELLDDGINIYNRHGILGADDRAGIYACLEAQKDLTNKPYILFTNYEECGGLGVKKACEAKLVKCKLEEMKLFIEADRKGIAEYVVYSPVCDGLHTLMKDLGYRENYGSYSDVATISDKTGIAHVNIGTGYFFQHTEMEYLNKNGLDFCIATLKTLVKYAETLKKPFFVDETKAYDYGFYGNFKYSGKKSKKAKQKSKTTIKMTELNKDYPEWVDIPSKNDDGDFDWITYDELNETKDFSYIDFDDEEEEIVHHCPDCGSNNVKSDPIIKDNDLFLCNDCNRIFIDKETCHV